MRGVHSFARTCLVRVDCNDRAIWAERVIDTAILRRYGSKCHCQLGMTLSIEEILGRRLKDLLLGK